MGVDPRKGIFVPQQRKNVLHKPKKKKDKPRKKKAALPQPQYEFLINEIVDKIVAKLSKGLPTHVYGPVVEPLADAMISIEPDESIVDVGIEEKPLTKGKVSKKKSGSTTTSKDKALGDTKSKLRRLKGKK